MSRYFVTDPPVAIPEFDASEVISDVQPNVIYIRAKMDTDADARVKNELVKMGDDDKTVEHHIGLYQMALLLHNIVKWEGPDLSSVPCTPANIRALDPTEPHIALVLEEIAKRNARKAGPSKKLPTPNTYANDGGRDSTVPDGAGLSLQLATGRSPLHSHLSSIGRQNRSEDSTPTT